MTRIIPIVIFCCLAGPAFAQPTLLSISRDNGAVRLGLQGEPRRDYFLQGNSDALAPGNWSPLLTLTLTNSLQTWLDAEAQSMPNRFYRLVKLDGAAPLITGSDFRLMDHLGASRNLYYHANAKAFVLLFADINAPNASQWVTSFKARRDQYKGKRLIFWIINTNPNLRRPELATHAGALSIDVPVLEDPAQMVARDYGITRAGEVVCIDPADQSIFYRGTVEDRIEMEGVVTTQDYLASALANFLAGEIVSPSRTPGQGNGLNLGSQTVPAYTTEIAPLLQTKCLVCHSPGNIGSFAMTDHATVRDYAPAMKLALLRHEMPPWHADPYFGVFANDRSLKPEEAAKLVGWIDAGAPRGEGADPLANAPPPPSVEWELGPPDQILSIPEQDIPDTGPIDYRYLDVTNTFPADVWLRAAVVRPGNRKVVHHVLVFSGTDSILRGIDGFFAGYVPGAEQKAFPEGTGKFLAKDTVLQFQMHYTSSGQPETDRTEIGLYTMPAKPAYPLQTKSAFQVLFVLPPGSTNTLVNASYKFAKDAVLYEMTPHMHFRGSHFKFEARYTNGFKEVLLSVPKYDFDWQTSYRLAEPKRLPAGTTLFCSGGFDNSNLNIYNPDPKSAVTFGLQTFNEMFIGYFNFAELP